MVWPRLLEDLVLWAAETARVLCLPAYKIEECFGIALFPELGGRTDRCVLVGGFVPAGFDEGGLCDHRRRCCESCS
jgi:hypothetical protein